MRLGQQEAMTCCDSSQTNNICHGVNICKKYLHPARLKQETREGMFRTDLMVTQLDMLLCYL